MPEIVIATRTGELRVGGHRYMLRRGKTTAHANHPAVLAYPHAWTPIPVTLRMPEPDGDGQSQGDAERRAAIRAWAAKQGIEVSPRGKIPQTVVDQYKAAHRG